MTSTEAAAQRSAVRSRFLVALLVTALLTGCGGGGVGAPGDSSQSSQSSDIVVSPTPIATLALSNGNTLEFYDFGDTALVSEVGRAYTAPAFNPGRPQSADQLTKVWRSLAREQPVPAALVELQDRLTNLQPDARGGASPSPAQHALSQLARGSTGGAPRSEGADGPAVVPSSPVGCNNGCCDYQWLSTFSQCQGSSFDYSWFSYNYGWSTASATLIGYYDGLVCSAKGTSTYSVSIEGMGGTWSVAQATYRTYWWFAGTTCNPFCHYDKKTMSSTVNTQASQHLHTYCGGVLF